MTPRIRIAGKSSLQSEPPADNAMGWLTTFNDLITLLMVFFVLLFSMGSMNANRFKHFLNGLQGTTGVLDEGRNATRGVISNRPLSIPGPSTPESHKQAFRKLAHAGGLEAEYTRRGIRLTLRDELLFSTGSARLTREGLQLLNRIGTVIKPMHRRIRIEGHTDDRSIATVRYPSNWELSMARAVRVVTYLIGECGIDPMLLSAAGYGACRPRVANDTDDHRALNRRVEIILSRRGNSLSEANHPPVQ